MAVLPHHVKNHVRDRDLFHFAADLRFGGQAHALLDLFEARPSIGVQRDDLAIEDHLPRTERASHSVALRIAPGDVLPASADELDDPSIDIGDGPDAIPLELESPRI